MLLQMENEDLLIRLRGVSMLREHKKVLSDVNLEVRKGDFIAVTGPNGGGKTTLLRIILRLLAPTGGSVEYFSGGQPVKRLSIGYLPQKNMTDSSFPLSVRDVVASGLLGIKVADRAEVERRTSEMLRAVGLEEKSGSPIGELSGGQFQRTLLARALVAKPDVLVLDEPLSYLDKHFEHRIYDIIASLPKDVTVILVSHEMTTIASMASRHVIVDHTVKECHSGSHMVHYDCSDECDCPECSATHRLEDQSV